MSVRTMARVWSDSGHAGSELLMLLAIADFADDEGNAYPAVPTLARKCRTTPRNANRVLAALRASGELLVRVNEGPRGTNRYQIVLQGMTLAPPLTPAPPRRTRPAPLTLAALPPDVGVPKPLTPASDEPSLNHQRTIKEPSRESAARPSRKCPDWFILTAELQSWAKDAHPLVSVAAETSKFKDHTFKNPTTDWSGAWRNWIRKAAEFQSQAHQATSRRTGSRSPQQFEDVDYTERAR